jgi:hypothetical protein
MMAVLALLISTPYQSALAALINTETVLAENQSQESRQYILELLAREEVRSTLIAQGIDPQEAKARIASLSDSEIIKLADQFDNLPAGQGIIGITIGVLIIVLLVVLIIKLVR